MSWSPARLLKAGLRKPADLYLRGHHALLGVPEGAVFILGHMRSGSTLLLHLLMSSPEVLAAGERNTVYSTSKDLHRLARDCFIVQRRPFGRVRYVADQLNHDHLMPDPRLLLHPMVQPVLLARAPGPSIGSMVRTFGPLYGDWPPERAAEYYVQRVHTLTEYAVRLQAAGRRFTFLSYEALTADPGQALAPLRQQLDLLRALSGRYTAARFTGQRGDPSDRIAAGEVRADAGAPVPVPDAWLWRAEEAYAALKAAVGA